MKRTFKPARIRRVALLIETSRSYGRDLLVGIAKFVRVHGPWSIDFEEGDPCGDVPPWFHRWEGDGVIARVKNRALAAAIQRKEVPAVDLFGGLPDLKMPTLRSDELAVGRLAAQHLLERGFRQFAFCGYNGTEWSDRRRDGFEAAIAGAGFPCQVFQNPHPTSHNPAGEYEEHGPKYEQQMIRWLAALPKPVGLMACNDSRARQVLNGCRSIQLGVPDEIAVVGVDKDEVLCELSDIPLSSVILNTEKIGFESAVMLDRMMAGEQAPSAAVLVAPKGLATKRSTEVLAIEDPHVAAALRLIRDHACEGFDVPALLRTVPLSRSSLERRFRQLLGRSPNAEILRIKLGRAQQLLMDSDLPLAGIAEKAGFANQEYLSRMFKKKVGATPGQFRARARGSLR